MEDFLKGLYIGINDSNDKPIHIGDKYTTINDNKLIYTVFFKGGAACGGESYESSIPLGWDFEDDEISLQTSWIQNHLKIIGDLDG